MLRFRDLYLALDRTQSTNEKVAILVEYFQSVPPEDAAWAVFFLSGNRLKRNVTSTLLARWCKEWLEIPDWLFEESYSAVGDTAETVVLLLPSHPIDDSIKDISLSELVEKHILPLTGLNEATKKAQVLYFWQRLDRETCFIFNKLLSGSFRVGASKQLTVKALGKALHVPQEKIAQALLRPHKPDKEFFENLKSISSPELEGRHPYPFFLASPFDGDLNALGKVQEWLAEWKWDGIRAQVICFDHQAFVWSRGNEMITHQCPEIAHLLSQSETPFVLDGELLAYADGKPMSFFELQKRLGRKNPSKKIMEEVPLAFMAYDVISYDYQDLRLEPLEKRRGILEKIVNEFHSPLFPISPKVEFANWEELKILQNTAKDRLVEGLMLKRLSSPYRSGRVRGDWWKYKVAPMTIDAVLLYAQPGSGRRANLYTDYTFAVWHNDQLIPITKAYSGLDQKEIDELDKWIRRNTVEKFGPVRQVKPFYVFEIAFENIQPSKRHKSGLALRFPHISRWRKDKTAQEADTLENVKQSFLP